MRRFKGSDEFDNRNFNRSAIHPGSGRAGEGEQEGGSMKEKVLNSDFERQIARNVRNMQWEMMERIEQHGTLWFCVWNKRRLPEAPDELRCCLLSGMDYLEWLNSHADWFERGEWSEERYASPIKLTDAGREALRHRELYDMEPHHGGLVEPGFVVTPLPK